MRLAELLRLTAISVALLCWLDPPVTVSPLPPIDADVVLVRSTLDDMPISNGASQTVADGVSSTAQAIAEALGDDGRIRLVEMRDARSVPCDAVRPCVIVSSPNPSVRAAADRRGVTSLVTVGDTLTPNLAVHALDASATHSAAEGVARVELSGPGLAGKRARVRLLDGSAVVGEATHTLADEPTSHVTIPWWPFAPGTRTLRAEAALEEGEEQTVLDNSTPSVVEVENTRWPIIVHERRPSWGVTFVRRALADDPRLDVSARTDVSPQVSALARSPAADLSEQQLDTARVVIVGAPDALTESDVQRLEHYVRRRGGSLVLVPDRPFTGPVLRLLSHRWRERLTDRAEDAGSLRASESLIAQDESPFDSVVARSAAGVTAVESPMGEGRILVVGAMDAWRHRGPGETFDRFWRATVARLAEATGPPVWVRASPEWTRPGEDVALRVSVRSMRVVNDWVVTADLICPDSPAETVRLWPGGAAGEFRGQMRPHPSSTRCETTARVASVGEGRAAIQVTPEAPTTGPAEEALQAVVARTGGITVEAREATRVVDALRAGRSTDRVAEQRHPMRSMWWMLPFAACLAGEWWLRRRIGLR